MGMRCAVAILALGPLAAFADLDIQKDRFRNRTELWAPSMEAVMKDANRGKLAFHVFTNFSGEKPEKAPLLARLAFRVMSEGSTYARCHRVDALVDGKPFALPDSGYKSDAMGKGALETIHVDLKWGDFTKIATSTAVEFRVCNTELKASPKVLEDWRALLKAATP
jgi:hypothetical protein